MASLAEQIDEEEEDKETDTFQNLLTSYLGLTFALFMASIPKSSLFLLPTLKSRNEDLSRRLAHAEEQLKQMKSRRIEDSKANARVVEIFAGHRNAWQQEERKLLEQIDAYGDEIRRLRARLEEFEESEVELKDQMGGLRRKVSERDEMIEGFMSRKSHGGSEGFGFGSERVIEESDNVGRNGSRGGACAREGESEDVGGDCYGRMRGLEGLGPMVEEESGGLYGEKSCFSSEFGSRMWAERAGLWQDVQYESLESVYHMKHFVPRRETPWKVDGESAGVASKLKLLEQELQNLETVGKSYVSKVPSFMRKQAKRYLALVGKIEDLCKRMQVSDPCEHTLSMEFRTKRQTEFLLEAFRLQQRASETGQKLMALQTEAGKNYLVGEPGIQAKLTTRLSLNSIKNNFREIQRNLEIWLARIIGDLEGILARDGASRARDYYISGYPFVQYDHLNGVLES